MSKYRAKPRDELGARKGTAVATVNRAMTTKWQSLDEIHKKTRLSRRAVARKLYYGVEKGLYEYEKIIRFKLKRKKK